MAVVLATIFTGQLRTRQKTGWTARNRMSNLSIVIPIYNDLASLRVLVDRIAQQPTRAEDTTRIIVIDDGSFPPIADQIGIPTDPVQLEVVTLKRNVGHQRAIAAGLAHEVAMKRADIIVI